MPRLAVITHKSCWPEEGSPSGYATDGGFPFQMGALSELFTETTLLLPRAREAARDGLAPLSGRELRVAPLTSLPPGNAPRKLLLPFWLLRNLGRIISEMRRADAVHALVPGDVGTVGMLLAWLLGKPLLVRHCGNWLSPSGLPDRMSRWVMERLAGGRNVMLATGGALSNPSPRNPVIKWIFSTSLREEEVETNVRVREGAPGSDARLVIACRQEKAKGSNLVIEALPRIHLRFPGVTFDVVGDGGYLDELRCLAGALGLGAKVVFHGKVDHATVIRLLREADLFCFPTTSSEGFPKAVVEALSCGLPVVTTRVSVLPRVIGTGCGVLLDEATPGAVADAVTGLLADGEGYLAMSRRARQTAAEYTLERWRDTIGEHLREAWGDALVDSPSSAALAPSTG